jgi:23S rRNA (uracil1939-C5)-methyltransferase
VTTTPPGAGKTSREAYRSGSCVEVEIGRLGGRGDGIAEVQGVRVYVPLTLPGDRLTVRLVARREGGFAAEPLMWHHQAPRSAPRCPHFGACGGCQLQHLPQSEIARWQCAQVATALARRGLDGLVVEPSPAMPATRRRARLAFRRRGRQVILGFRGRSAHRIVDIERCALVVPEIEGLLPRLREALLALPVARQGGEVLVTAAQNGLDLVILGVAEPGLEDRERIAALADAQDLARVSWQSRAGDEPEVIVRRRPPQVSFDGILVEPPPGAFLQATADAEAQIRAAVRAAIEPAIVGGGAVADLFAGCGTIALPLAAAGHTVRAIELDAAMVAALSTAARHAGLADRVTAAVRDLARSPLAGADLGRLDAVILDPPRAGAMAQARMLAASPVGRIAMVSCNPASFARDSRILADGGFRLSAVRLIDAFSWSAQIELVGTFERRGCLHGSRAKFGA